MELKKLDKSVLKLWYIRAAIGALALLGGHYKPCDASENQCAIQ